MDTNICPVCSNTLFGGYEPWHSICRKCNYEKAQLLPNINSETAHEHIDERARESGLHALRVSNFQKLLQEIQLQSPGQTLLEVGCAHGWFLEEAIKKIKAMGLEPDKAIFDAAIKKNLPIRNGYFPQALKDDEKFDVIVFNDVIEHIPDIQQVVNACYERLNINGLLVLNLPSSRGIFYRLSKALFKLGVKQFFERLWQKDLPSPHVHYFDSENLKSLLSKSGFKVQAEGSLPTLKLTGLYTRVSYAGSQNFLVNTLIYFGIASSLPLLKILPKDIIYNISMKTES